MFSLDGVCQLNDQPVGGTVLLNQGFTMSCSFHSPLPPTVVWFKDNEERGTDFGGTRINITYNAATGVSTYTFSDATYDDAGDYSCESRDENSQPLVTSDEATIVIHGTPMFGSLLQALTISVGASAQFTCSVEAVPAATISWSYNEQTLTTGGQFVVTAGTLIISNVQMSNDGFYKCTATNTYGTNSTSARLTVTGIISLVLFPLVFIVLFPYSIAAAVNPTVTITEGSQLTVGQGGSTILHCTVDGDNIAFIRWVKSG